MDRVAGGFLQYPLLPRSSESASEPSANDSLHSHYARDSPMGGWEGGESQGYVNGESQLRVAVGTPKLRAVEGGPPRLNI